MDKVSRYEVIACLAGWSVSCELKMSEDWEKYRRALKSKMYVDFWRKMVRSDISRLRHARKVLKEF